MVEIILTLCVAAIVGGCESPSEAYATDQCYATSYDPRRREVAYPSLDESRSCTQLDINGEGIGPDGSSRPFPIPVTRANDTAEKWLSIDPLQTCKLLFNSPVQHWETFDGIHMPRRIAAPLEKCLSSRHSDAEIVKYIDHVDGVANAL